VGSIHFSSPSHWLPLQTKPFYIPFQCYYWCCHHCQHHFTCLHLSCLFNFSLHLIRENTLRTEPCETVYDESVVQNLSDTGKKEKETFNCVQVLFYFFLVCLRFGRQSHSKIEMA
jgi:hypothetical protein